MVNNVGSVLVLACTNHALDQLLSNILQDGFAERVVRIGSRLKDEAIAAVSLFVALLALLRD